MTDSSPPPMPPESPETAPELSPAARLTGWLLLIVSLAGMAVHGVLLFSVYEWPDWRLPVHEYVYGLGMKIVCVACLACLFGSWFHYHRTRMTLDIVSRIATYLWIVTIVLLFQALYKLAS